MTERHIRAYFLVYHNLVLAGWKPERALWGPKFYRVDWKRGSTSSMGVATLDKESALTMSLETMRGYVEHAPTGNFGPSF